MRNEGSIREQLLFYYILFVDGDCPLQGIDFLGSDIAGVPAFSWQECSIKCRGNQECTAWTFNNMEDQCWMKTPGFRIFPITYDNNVRDNVYSGARHCGHTEGEVLEDTRTGKDHP